MKLLAIDDNADNLVSLAAMLRTYLPGCEVATAPSGAKGIGLARTFQPDTILLDIQMPDMDGFEACQTLKADPLTRHIPVLFLTARHADPASRIRGLEIGGDAFLTKPVEPGELMAQVRGMVRIKRAEDALRGEKASLERMVAERTTALRQSENHFRHLIQVAPFPMAFNTGDGVIREVNDRFTEVFGYTWEDIPNVDTWFRLAYPDETYRSWLLETWNAATSKAKEKRDEVEPIECRVTCKNGEVRVMVISGVPVGDDLLVTFFDLTEHKRAEEKLEETFHLLTEAQRVAQMGWYVFHVAAGRWLSSELLDRLFGITDSDYPKTPEGWLAIVHPEDRQRMGDYLLHHVLEEGHPFDREYRIVRLADGQERWVYGRGELVRDGDGQIVKMIGVIRDITERRRAEEALRTSEEKFRKAFDMGPDSININRLHDGLYVSINQGFTQIMGYTEADVMGRTSMNLNIWDRPEDRMKILDHISRNGVVANFEARFRSKSGEVKHGLMSASLIEIDGTPHLLSITRDITARKRLEQDLEAAKKLETIGMITGGVAHEVRNPLNSIQIMAAVLEKKQGDDPDIRQCVAHIQEQVQRLSLLMKDLLLLGWPTDSTAFAPCDLLALTRAAAQNAEAEIAGRAGRVQITADGPLPPVQGDADKLTQVLVNILQNALTLSPEGTPVEVQISLEKGQARIRVSDKGPGIPEEFLPRLFQPFLSKRKGGTGLGLAIVQKIVADHGGTVEAKNNDPLPGATFTVRLPVSQASGRRTTP